MIQQIEKYFLDTINLGPDGQKRFIKLIQMNLPTGAYTLNAKRGESSQILQYLLVGLTTGSGAISLQTTKDEYKQGEQVLILGKTVQLMFY